MKQTNFRGKAVKFLVHCFFPTRCPFCRVCIPYDHHVCESCGTLIHQHQSFVLTNCRENGIFFDALAIPFRYGAGAELAVCDLKFRENVSVAEHLGWFQTKLLEESELMDFDVITAVPMTKKHKRKRGYNQAAVLGKAVARYTKKPYKELLKKIKETDVQHTLSKERRKYNLKDAYISQHEEVIKEKTILLVDDVFTTGATANECAKTLLHAGAKRVMISAVCHTSNNRKYIGQDNLEN